MFKPIKWIKKKFGKRKKNKGTLKDPWGKPTKIKDVKQKSLNYPKIPDYPKLRIPGLSYFKMLISAFLFINMIFLVLGMMLNYLPSPMNQYIMMLFILTAFISLDHIWTKRKVLRNKALEVSFKKIKTESKTKKNKKNKKGRLKSNGRV